MKMAEAAVIGTVFTDIKGFSASVYVPHGRNQGRVELARGGVGRNVAENLANLGLSVRFVSSVDRGMLGEGVLRQLDELGVDTSFVKTAPDGGMGLWMLINDHLGEQAGSLSQQPDPSYTESVLRERGDELMERCASVLLETDFSPAITALTLELAERRGRPVYGLPSTMASVLAEPSILSRMECFICNHIEAARLFGAELTDDPEAVLSRLTQTAPRLGLPSMIVTMGAAGAVYWDGRSDTRGHVPAETVDVVDSSGAGDAFFSGTVSALIRGMSMERAAVCGTRLAALTIQVSSCNRDRASIQQAGIL